MADIKKARAAFMEMVEDLDPEVKCMFPAKATQGNYVIELSREGDDEKQTVKVSEKDLLNLEEDEDVRQKLEERVMAAVDKLPEPSEDSEDEEEFDEDELEEGDEEEDVEDEEEEEEEEAGDEEE
jgi:hypothetical protein